MCKIKPIRKILTLAIISFNIFKKKQFFHRVAKNLFFLFNVLFKTQNNSFFKSFFVQNQTQLHALDDYEKFNRLYPVGLLLNI
ncbi:hypothetical protein AK89_13945 [Enterococcus mundtii CRL35]|nr:hypothetical protein AK89_13945 [Enterococcus mundtii CRL35]